MGIFALSANTASQIVIKEYRPRRIRVSSDSTTMARICRTEEETTSSISGEIVTAYESKMYFIPPGTELYAISTGTPNISVTEVPLI